MRLDRARRLSRSLAASYTSIATWAASTRVSSMAADVGDLTTVDGIGRQVPATDVHRRPQFDAAVKADFGKPTAHTAVDIPIGAIGQVAGHPADRRAPPEFADYAFTAVASGRAVASATTVSCHYIVGSNDTYRGPEAPA